MSFNRKKQQHFDRVLYYSYQIQNMKFRNYFDRKEKKECRVKMCKFWSILKLSLQLALSTPW